jgi:hypothetical protein
MSREDHRLHDEIVALRRQLEQSKEPSSDMRFSAKEFILVATTTLLSFAGMLSENEMVMYFCLGASCVAYLYVCLKHPGSRFWRSVAAVIVSVVFAVMMFLVYQRDLKKEQDDVYAKLTVQPYMPTSRDVFKAGFTVTNGGSTDISEYSVICGAKRIVMFPAGGIENLGLQTTLPKRTGLRANGDADTSYCSIGITFQGQGSSLVCADITVTVPYLISGRPGIKKTKRFRFVAEGEDRVWHQHPVDYPGDYCPPVKFGLNN